MSKRHILKSGQELFTKNGDKTSWIYIRDVEYRKYGKTIRRIIEVECICGKRKDVQYNNVVGGHSVCCGTGLCKKPYNKNTRSSETTYNSIYYAYKKGAEKRGYDFNLSRDDFKNFLNKNCYYCGSKPTNIYKITNSKTKEVRAGIPIVYNGIDRIDNSIGYTIENSITCCETCNRMKTNHTLDFFIKHIEKILLNLKQK